MLHVLYVFGALALIAMAVLLVGFYCTKNGFNTRNESESFARLMFLASVVCVVSGTAWIILAVINWWDVYIAATLVGLLFLYVVSPVVSRNHDGETLVIWFNTRWLKHNGVWEKH